MTVADPLFAQWLQADALFVVREDATVNTRWGETAKTSERITNIALKADAEAEADRQIAFLHGPLVSEEHQLKGEWASYIGRVITLTVDELGYNAGLDVFVTGVEDNRAAGTSTVTVLRRL